MPMKISIITATFQSARTLRDTIDSVHRQTWPDLEHIIVDGKSTDGTLSIVSAHDHLTKVISEPDRGIYDAMNKGIALADGEVIGILNSDDFYADERVIADIAERFMDPAVDAVYGDLDYIHAQDSSRLTRRWKAGRYQPGGFRWGWMPPHPTFFVRRRLYEQYGGFNLDMGTCGDYELMLRLVHRHGARLSYVPRTLVKMRAGGASNASLAARLKANQNDRLAWTINGLNPYWFTLWLKPLRKIGQFLYRG
jgi:glycosyltransferase involved in cell wall biosynthesis